MLQKNDNLGMLELFFKKPLYSFHLRELCRTLDWSTTKVRAHLNILKKDGLILELREKHLSIFRANRESEEFKKFKILYNMRNAFEIAGIIEKNIDDFDAVVFFGSARRGEDTENSDFDVCIIGAEEKDIDFSDAEKAINRKISPIFAESLKMLVRHNKELSNNLLNGIIVKGYLKVFE